MQKLWWLTIGCTSLLLLNACQGKQAAQVEHPPGQDSSPAQMSSPDSSLNPKGPGFSAVPLDPAHMPVVAIGGKTPAANLQSQIPPPPPPPSSGSQRDPFAASLPTQLATVPAATPAPPKAQPRAPQSRMQRPSPAVATRQIPIAALPPLSIPAPPPIALPERQPAAPVPSSPPAAPVPSYPPVAPPPSTRSAPRPTASATALADAVQITGVVRTGNQIMVIAKAADEPTARYLQAGDSLSGGRVVVQAIEMNGKGEPQVILQQNGVKVTKRVGE